MERLLGMDREARRELGRRARAHVEAHCAAGVLAERFEQSLLKACQTCNRSAHVG
jgi:hypothetical protein